MLRIIPTALSVLAYWILRHVFVVTDISGYTIKNKPLLCQGYAMATQKKQKSGDISFYNGVFGGKKGVFWIQLALYGFCFCVPSVCQLI